MKRLLFGIISALLLCVMPLQAQTTDVLKKASSQVKKDGGVTVGFTITDGSSSDKGTLLMKGTKFHCVMGDLMTWYDGKSLWSFVKENNEVNLTTPTRSELAKINPYYFLDFYKKGYKVTAGKSTSQYYEVILTAENAKTTLANIVVRVGKSDYRPKYLKATTNKNQTLEITVTSYKKGQKFSDATFRFDKNKYPKAEIIDLR